MKLIIILFFICINFIVSVKQKKSNLRSEILDENFKDFGKFAQSLFKDDFGGNNLHSCYFFNIQITRIMLII